VAAFLDAFCPIDGLVLGSKTINNALKNGMSNSAVKDHAIWDLAGSLTCANGHTWAASGRIEVRMDRGGTSG
jgi:hypothetical protein